VSAEERINKPGVAPSCIAIDSRCGRNEVIQRSSLVANQLTTGYYRPVPKMTAFEAKTRFGELLHRVERGEEIVITRHDRPIARVVREGAPSLDSVKRSVEGLRQLQQRIRKRGRGKSALSLAEVRAAIGHGRR